MKKKRIALNIEYMILSLKTSIKSKFLSISANSEASLPHARAFVKCPPAHKNRDLQVNLQSLYSCAFTRLSHCFRDYSMIEATRPDPTVRPPSRMQVIEIPFTICDKSRTFVYHLYIFVCIIHRFRIF